MSRLSSLLQFSDIDYLRCTHVSSNSLSNFIETRNDSIASDTSLSINTNDMASGLTCRVCGVGKDKQEGFLSVADQREHFRSDWHHYNLQKCQKKQQTLTLDEFNLKIKNDDISSISGSDDDSEEDNDATLQKNNGVKQQSMETFDNGDGSYFMIWSCLLTTSSYLNDNASPEQAFHCLKDMQKWCVILAKGGHFAAACFEKLGPMNVRSKTDNPLYKVNGHKTFHRYVVRAKSGSRQSAKDASGKYAKSAGATLRRYNEAALEKDIQGILKSWTTELAACTFIFLSVSEIDRKAISTGHQPCFTLHDARIRNVPFPTRRPTFSEAKRVSTILMSTFTDKSNSAPLSACTEVPAASFLKTDAIPNQFIQEKLQDNCNALDAIANTKSSTSLPSKKKKNKRKTKTKDQRRQQAVEKAETVEDDETAVQKTEEDEVERAVAEASKQFSKLATRQKGRQREQKDDPVEDRRKLLRDAAERRMNALQNASKSQTLW